MTRLPHLPSTMRLCALLSRSPTSISLAYRMLHIPPQDVLQIYSAALAADMIRVVCAQPADKSVAAPAHSNRVIERVASFWESMLNRIAGL